MPHVKANWGFVCYNFLKLTSSHILLPYYRLCLVKVLSCSNALIFVLVFNFYIIAFMLKFAENGMWKILIKPLKKVDFLNLF